MCVPDADLIATNDMDAYLTQWLYFLRDTKGATALPLMIFGVVLMILGWRMWRVCVVLSFGLLGALVTLKLASGSKHELTLAAVVGLVAAAISFKPAKWAVGALGGLLGAGLLLYALSEAELSPLTTWSLAAGGLVAGAAYSCLHRQHMVVLVTSFLGAAMLMSGIAAMCLNSSSITGTFNSMASYSNIVVPFVMLVPTVVACFYQISEMRRLGVDF